MRLGCLGSGPIDVLSEERDSLTAPHPRGHLGGVVNMITCPVPLLRKLDVKTLRPFGVVPIERTVRSNCARVMHQRVQLVQVEVVLFAAAEFNENILVGVEATKGVLEVGDGCVGVSREGSVMDEVHHCGGGADRPWIGTVHDTHEHLLHVLMLGSICLREARDGIEVPNI